MNRQQQIDRFLANAHRLAIDRLRANPPGVDALERAVCADDRHAGRDKDGDFVRTLLREGMIDIATLLARIRLLDQRDRPVDSIVVWAERRAAEAQT
jgi:hypothetical protein